MKCFIVISNFMAMLYKMLKLAFKKTASSVKTASP